MTGRRSGRAPKSTVACPRCGSRRLPTTDSLVDVHGSLLRRRVCPCGRIWITRERVEEETAKRKFPARG